MRWPSDRMRIELAHTGIEQSCHAPGVLSAVLDFAKRHATGWHVVALSGKIKLLERPQLAGGFQGQWLAEFRTDQSPQIKKSGLVNVRADCLAVFGHPLPPEADERLLAIERCNQHAGVVRFLVAIREDRQYERPFVPISGCPSPRQPAE